ncbi:MAG: hypothetical protein KF678_12505 [Phycisphaeraceae bacterium]|nr:hypothetical protein [Phycisphaeraceae bacterium]
MARCVSIVLLGMCLVVGCASRPEAGLRVSYLADSATSPQVSHAFVVEVEGVGVDRIPEHAGTEPSSSRSTLIVGPANEIKSASPSPAEWVIVDADRELPSPGYHALYGTVQAARRSRIVVPDGATAVLAIGTTDLRSAPIVEVLLRAGPGVPDLRLRARRLATEEEAILKRSGEEAQTIQVPWPLPERDGTFQLAVPGIDGSSRPSIWRLTSRAPSDDEQAEARAIASSLTPAAPSNAQAAALSASLRHAMTAHEARRALAFAALDAAAAVTSEAAVLASDAAILKLASSGAEALSADRIADAGWTLDRSTITVLGRLHGENSLDRALAGALSARFGEVGRDVGTLARLAAASGTHSDFESRLKAEHLIYLDDSSPSARVRAFDWLNARGEAPSGFDPLGSLPDRRESLDRHMDAIRGGTRP